MAGAIYDQTNSYAIPFFVAGGLFAISAVTSFIAPCLRREKPEERAIICEDDALTPIDEDNEEEDGPITMGTGKIPEIIKTASSPDEREIKQIESVL